MFDKINVQNPINGTPTVTVTVGTVADIAGNIVVVKSECVYLVPKEPIQGYGVDGLKVMQEYSIMDVMLMINSLGHAAMNQEKQVDTVVTVISLEDRLLGN